MRLLTMPGILTLMLMLLPGFVFAENVIDDSKNTEFLKSFQKLLKIYM